MDDKSSPGRGGEPRREASGWRGAASGEPREARRLHQPSAGVSPRAGEDRVRTAIAAATAAIATVSDTPRLDAELLMAHALGVSRDDLLLRRLDDAAPPAFDTFVTRRLAHEPIAYITGTRAFWTIDLAVGPGALVPRADSETLIEAAITHFTDRAPATILDLGTGPGTLLLAALDQWPRASGLGVDRSPQALAMAHANATRLGIEDTSELEARLFGLLEQ